MSKPRLQDDFYRYVNYKWLKETKIPNDAVSTGSFYKLRRKVQKQLKEIVQNIKPTNHNKSLIYNLYESYMNTNLIEKKGINVLSDDFKSVNSINNLDDFSCVSAVLNKKGYDNIFDIGVSKHPYILDKNIMYFEQSGLSLPDRDYYIDNKFETILKEYKNYIIKIVKLSIDNMPSTWADFTAEDIKDIIIKIETKIAQNHMNVVDSRDVEKIINLCSYNDLKKIVSAFNFDTFFEALGLDTNKLTEVNIVNKDYFKSLDNLLKSYTIKEWKVYITWIIINCSCKLIGIKYEDASFDFYGKIIAGQSVKKDRWKSALDVVDGIIGEALGIEYIGNHFSEQSKKDVLKLVDSLKVAYKKSIENLDWMTAPTKKNALKKLNKLDVKIGYPDKWRDYSKLEFSVDNLYGNFINASEFEINYELEQLDKKPDKNRWHMSPQTVNAYFNPTENEIVFPAAILQKPFYDFDYIIEKSYGGIGSIIGHEIGHCFDDQGSKFDENGRVHDWWDKTDKEKFQKMANALIEQYNKYSPMQLNNPTFKVNGALTVGENIGDIGGIEISLKALQIVKSDLTENDAKTFFMHWARCERTLVKNETLITLLQIDPHSPAEFRVNGVISNVNVFYNIFDVKPTDKLYLDPKKRISIWR